MSSSLQLSRKPYTGSCHCGHVKYIVYLSLPALSYPKTTETEFRKQSGQRIYKCNCTLCHKAGIFHIRIVNPPEDFLVISPLDPFAEGSGFKRYVPEGCESSWQFCDKSGTRTFAMRGDGSEKELGYQEKIELPKALLARLHSRTLNGTTGPIPDDGDEMVNVSVWRPKKDWKDYNDEDSGGSDSLSVNAISIDAHNENWDLRRLHEQGYVAYVQTLEEVGNDFEDKPYFGGTY